MLVLKVMGVSLLLLLTESDQVYKPEQFICIMINSYLVLFLLSILSLRIEGQLLELARLTLNYFHYCRRNIGETEVSIHVSVVQTAYSGN